MSLTTGLRNRCCPICRADARDAALFLRGTVEEGRITEFTYASRKTPEFMSYELRKCRMCHVVFACEAPDNAEISRAYHNAAYDSAVEAAAAAKTYAGVLKPYLAWLKRRGISLEVGTGNGVFLKHLRQMGFKEAVGIEPSQAAIDAAAPEDKAGIRSGIFTGDEFPPGSLSLVVCFQTMEHVPNPRGLVVAAMKLLEPGGMLALVTHDYTSWVNRLLGARSPIIDVEHLQLFHGASLRRLLKDAGHKVEAIHSFKNVYRLSYWIRLLPLPNGVKQWLLKMAEKAGYAEAEIGLNVGNMVAIAVKP